jgi:SSS family solute:Na+ symporter
MLRLVWMALLVFSHRKGHRHHDWSRAGGRAVDRFGYRGLRGGLHNVGRAAAVVITDLMQTILLYGGALLVIGTISWKMGGGRVVSHGVAG